MSAHLRVWDERGAASKIKTAHTEVQEAGETVVVSFTTAGGREKWKIPLRTD